MSVQCCGCKVREVLLDQGEDSFNEAFSFPQWLPLESPGTEVEASTFALLHLVVHCF